MKEKKGMTDAQLEAVAQQFGILAESSRLRLLRALMGGPMNVTELIEATGMKQGNVSKHLGVLLQARFVAREQQGNFARYTLANPMLFPLCELMCGSVEEDAKRRMQELSR
ncbi:MAG TPA: metalloregulator ArsR/SmtB family transcription factor [Bacteroidia bacterium]|nr:metalloregulator ArsR/SmtB family transcription factor [Bacteroidia bacterium]